MKSKLLIGAFVLAIAYSCTTQKAVVEEIKPQIKIDEATLVEGKSLYEVNCAKCHKLYDKTDYTATEWTPIVLSMQKKAKISDEQREKIYAYLITP